MKRLKLFLITSFNILRISLLNPGKVIEIDKKTGVVKVANEQQD